MNARRGRLWAVRPGQVADPTQGKLMAYMEKHSREISMEQRRELMSLIITMQLQGKYEKITPPSVPPSQNTQALSKEAFEPLLDKWLQVIEEAAPKRVTWRGHLTAIQPRIRLLRSFDERQHSYLGYVLWLRGTIDNAERECSVAIGKEAQTKHAFRVGDEVSGEALPVADPEQEVAEFYKASGLEVVQRQPEMPSPSAPPFLGVPPELEIYRQRGHRRLDAKTYAAKCPTCIWGCKMPVEMIIDQWNPSVRKHRFETFCYGPKSCSLYKAGAKRQVPGRKGMVHVEEDWVDEDATHHRGPDE